MYNTHIPSNMELPSTAKLIKSTILALISAGIILVTVVMPAEYGIDPTGIGKVLGLKQMGDIKQDLARKVETDAKSHTTEQGNHGAGNHQREEKGERPKSAKEIFNNRQSKGHQHGDGNYHHH